ncbi:M28 family peptidase [Flavobacteriaceae bacterium]|nr:M28 family peptidase [Flavobacteriaceae bacterium]MDB2491255.1 M28 family peptidase [Flavobacteriaceae bacterium]
MKKILLLTSALLMMVSCQKEATKEDVVNYGSSITQDELKEHLYIYASDEFEGRDTGNPGQKKAVDYIKKHYESLGIKPVIEGNYFQNVPLNLVKTPKVTITNNGKSFNYFEDFISLGSTISTKISASEIVYAGFGIDDEQFSNYTNIDVKGKIVVIKNGEPKDKNGNYIITGNKKASKWSNGRQELSAKRNAAKDKGAKTLFLMNDNLFNRYSLYYKGLEERGAGNRLSLPVKKDAEADMYQFLISNKMGKSLIANIEKSVKPSYEKTTFEMILEASSESKPSENVAAIIKGSEKPDEYIIISSHLDHIGIDGDGEVFNGADDDGSGTVAMLEIAEAFKTAADNGHKPKRSIIFLHVTGEEKGLLGSRYYTDHEPLVPLENTITDLNIDMIGRIDPKREGDRNYIYLIGSDKLSTDLHNISEQVNKEFVNIELDYKYNAENDPNRFYYRSDHYSFAKNNIPVIFYFNGTHADYHQISDTPDKINYDLLENRSRLIFHTAWEIANREERLIVDKIQEKVKP